MREVRICLTSWMDGARSIETSDERSRGMLNQLRRTVILSHEKVLVSTKKSIHNIIEFLIFNYFLFVGLWRAEIALG